MLLVCGLLFSNIITVDQTGAGDFLSIQEGINSAVDADTVLVHPGTYFENIDFIGKNITVSSLFLTTQEEDYVNETIINGNQNGSCVRIMSGEDSTTVLCGFTITNGSGSPWYEGCPSHGGAILFMDSQTSIIACNIFGNYAEIGGGIFCRNSQITLSDVDIIGNYADGGGGISTREYSEIYFDQNNLCNIYLNYAGRGCEILKAYSSPAMEVYVDTFTVFEPDAYFIMSTDTFAEPLNDVTMHIQNAKLTPINSDLYVATDGDNNNNGLTEDEPLATLNYALSLVKSDSLHPNTIHIKNGTYSRSLNNNFFPLCTRGYVSLIGESMDNTILDAEDLAMHLFNYHSAINYTIKNITFTHGNGENSFAACMFVNVRSRPNNFINIEDVIITDFTCTGRRLLELYNVDIYMNNVISLNNHSPTLRPSSSNQPEIDILIENSKFCNNDHDPSNGTVYQMLLGDSSFNPKNATLINCEITDNNSYQSEYPVRCSGIYVKYNVELTIINCTIGNNTSPNSGGPIVISSEGSGSSINIYNSVLYGDSPSEIYIDNEYSDNPASVTIQNSLVDGGCEGIQNVHTWNEVYWLDGNLDTDPLWQNEGEFPYMLTENSPCIDTGTLDLPDGIILPEFDLAGNPRISGDTIDMGAYEYQDSVVSQDIEIPINKTDINCYPNPFNPTTNIKLKLSESGIIKLKIYNLKGQVIRTILDAYASKGLLNIVWNGEDDFGRKVSSGQYFVRLEQNGNVIISKVLCLK